MAVCSHIVKKLLTADKSFKAGMKRTQKRAERHNEYLAHVLFHDLALVNVILVTSIIQRIIFLNVHFSIIIPYFNKSMGINSTLDSLLHQTFVGFEVIVIDDGSIPALSFNHTDLFNGSFFLLSTPNQGVSVARNIGASLAKNEWLIFLDAGDTVEESFLFELAKSINQYKNINIHATSFSFVKNGIKSKAKNCLSSTSEIISYQKYIKLLVESNQLFHICSLCVKKNLFFSVNGFSVGATHGEDHEFILKAILNEGNLRFINKPMFNYSLDDENSVTRSDKKIPIYCHSWYLSKKTKPDPVEVDYLTSTVVDNFIVNIKNRHLVFAIKNTFQFFLKINLIFFVKNFLSRAVNYEKK